MSQRWNNRLTLRTKAMVITVVITTVSLAAVATTGLLQIRGQIDADQHRAAESVAMSVARASELALAVRDRNELTRLANSFLRDENILFIAVYGQAKLPIAYVIRDRPAWEAYLRGAPDGGRRVVAERRIEVAPGNGDFSVEPDPEDDSAEEAANARDNGTLGRVVVGISTEASAAALGQQSRLTVAATAGAAAVGAIVLFLTIGTWTRRLDRLAAASQAISRGDFDACVEDGHDDEIGRLSQSFDSMRLALRERDRKLNHFTDTLQVQVRQRTRDLERALAAAEEASRAKSLFLANMSHELRTPLNGVIGMVDLLMTTEVNSQQRRYCEVAKASARSLVDQINDVLDFSKIEAGKLELDASEFDLHETVEQVVQMLGERAEKKHLELVCSVAADVPRMVSGDQIRLRQVVLNLTSNAVKFTERGEVVVSAAVEQQTPSHAVIKISIRDTGIGIPPGRIDRLFKSFSQVDASTTRKFGGTGLGLAISQRIVELMGGKIGVHSEEGKGATFWFTARLEKRDRAAAPHRDTTVDPRGLRVLAVDDNLTNREILHAQLASWGMRADVAQDAGQAMDLLRLAARNGEPYKLALLDVRMPGIDGLQLARQIKSDPATCGVILISLSSICEPLKPRQMIELGFAASLSKPALPSQLYNTIVNSLAAEAPGNVPIPPADAATPKLPGVRVLLAEDNEVNRLVASELLKQAGCICTMVVNGREALDAALSGHFDAILMDCQMPEMDGYEATRRIREAEAADPRQMRRPIIALTANAIKGDRELCLAAGMDAYVTKPIDPVELLGTIQLLVSQPAPHEPSAGDGARQAVSASAAESRSVEPQEIPVDLPSLKRRCMGNRKIAAQALTTFDQAVMKDMQSLMQSVRSGDAPAAASSAHKIKGAAANVSAEAIRETASRLEQLAKADELSHLQASLDQLHREVDRFREYLQVALKGLTPPADSARPISTGPDPR